jgi:hypothetical protein
LQVNNQPWSNELLVLDDRSELDTYVIPVEGCTVEIIQTSSNDDVQFTVELQSVQD